MEEQTTTEAPVQDTGVQETQPVEQEAEAVQQNDQTQSDTNDGGQETQQQAEGNDDFDYEAWLDKKGIDPTTQEGKAQIAKSWREIEKKMHQTTSQASALNKQLTEQPLTQQTTDPMVNELAGKLELMERERKVEKFKSEAKLSPEQESKMVEYITANPQKAQLVNAGYMSLNEVYQLSGANAVDKDAIAKQGGQKALETLANKQRATAPTGAATNQKSSTPVTAANVEEWWDGLGISGRSDPANRAKLDALLQGK